MGFHEDMSDLRIMFSVGFFLLACVVSAIVWLCTLIPWQVVLIGLPLVVAFVLLLRSFIKK